jgi:hypothetical protein
LISAWQAATSVATFQSPQAEYDLISNLATNLQARVKNKRLTSEYDGMARALKLSARNSTLLQD